MLLLTRRRVCSLVNMYIYHLILIFLIFKSTIALQTTNFNLRANVISGKSVNITWSDELLRYDNASKINLKLISFNEKEDNKLRSFPIERNKESQLMINDLIPGGSYEAQLKVDLLNNRTNVTTITDGLDEKSSIYDSFNFTTKPNTPGRFIVWFRNTSSLLILWQPAYPAGIFDRYKVSIDPQDAFHSEMFVNKDSDPPGPSQAAFYGLIPGRAYTITVQALSKDQISKPMLGRYRTVPLPPDEINVDLESLDTTSFVITWKKPSSYTEFDRYQASLTLRSAGPQIVDKDAPLRVKFSENLEPGRTYETVIKTVSGNVASWPMAKNVTTKPLPVLNLFSHLTLKNEIELKWVASNESQQDSFIVRYHELEAFNTDGTVQVVKNNKVLLQNLLDGRNYSISVFAVSNGVKSSESITFQTTKPGTPVIETLESVNAQHTSFNVTWKSDVTSRQDEFKVTYQRKDQPAKSKVEKKTKHNWIVLEDLYPGATYSINVSALSYGLSSEPHQYIQTIYPKSPESLQIVKASNSTVILTWSAPKDSLIDNYIVRYRPISSTLWREMSVNNITSNEISDLMPGEKYIIKVNTLSNKIESVDAKEIEQTMYPNGVESVSHVIGSTNITFKLITPLGRIDYYIIVYNPTNDLTAAESSKQILSNNRTHFGDTVNAVVDSLKPGELYSFRFFAVSHQLRSEALTLRLLRTKPVINSVINIVTYEQETRTLGIKFTPTPRRSSTFDRYRFQLTSDLSIPAQEKLHNDTSRLVLFDNLIPGRLYNLSVWTVSGGIYSQPIQREVRLYPGSIKNLQAIRITDTEITLSWDQPDGPSDKDGYEITYLDQQLPHRLIRNFTFYETITYQNLKPHQNYSFEVLTISGYNTSTLLRSSPVSQTFTTLESTPGKVALFHPINITPNSITFEWHLPQSEKNGVITGFEIRYFAKSNYFNHTNAARFDATATSGTINQLQSGIHYVFICSAHTRVGPGSSAQYELEMPVWAPPKSSFTAVEVGKTSRTIRIQFKKSFFSNAHGQVKYYAIIITEDPTNTAAYFSTNDELELPTWFDVQGKTVWPTYQTSDYFNPFESSSVTDYVVGSDTNCEKVYYQNGGHKSVYIENLSDKKSKYCNGPLKPGSSFRVKIRAFTGPKKFTDTVYSSLIVTEQDSKAIFTTVIVLFSILIIFLIGLLLYKRRQLNILANSKNGFGLKNRLQPTLTTTPGYHSAGLTLSNTLMSNSMLQKTAYENDSFNNLSEAELINEKRIKLSNFAEHFRLLSRDSDYLFSFQFEQLRNVGKENPCTAADLPVNRPKNRFTNILPYDHSRVKLQPTDDEEGSDYINANYVAGASSPREYIVTQGPLHGTRDDFWRMIFEQNCKAIVMLTKCIEKGREKCDRYYPVNTQPVYYGDIQVTLLNESQYSNWTISEFKIQRGDVNRTIKHFYFTSWPDFGVPEPPSLLTRFVRTFRERVPPDSNRPITTHCSAGVGRSGTFIALDSLLQHIKHNDYVNIFELVYEMRKSRACMVQNEQQYICIHQCLLAALEGNKQDLLIESPRPERENQAYVDDDEGIAESGI